MPAAEFDLDHAAGNEIHGVAALAFANDGGAGGHRARLEHADQIGDRGGVEARKQRHARHHGEGDDEVAAADLLVKAAAEDGDRQCKAADSEHDGNGGNKPPERGEGRNVAAADLCNHGGGPPNGFRHVAELVGLEGAFHGMHGGRGQEQDAGKNDDAGKQRAPLAGNETAEGGERRRIARELEKAHQARQRRQRAVRENELEQQRQQRQRIDDHQRRCRKAQARAQRAVLPEQGMLRRGPQARDILDGEDEHAHPVEQLQAGAVSRGDVGHSLGHGRGDVADNEPDQHPVDDARGGLPAPPVLQDLEGALAQYARALSLGVH